MGFPPAPPFGEPRPLEIREKVAEAVRKIRSAGKVAGTLTTLEEIPQRRDDGVQFFYVHSDPFLRRGVNAVKSALASD
ncbi:2-keto-3-deoxy-L-rhamnonate aldolase RhmA [Rhizobium sp. BK060]|nr:2-keto-3-deoxy-L-rhamnonate aldolase RhmA [Rhizobium sp. BK060]